MSDLLCLAQGCSMGLSLLVQVTAFCCLICMQADALRTQAKLRAEGPVVDRDEAEMRACIACIRTHSRAGAACHTCTRQM